MKLADCVAWARQAPVTAATTIACCAIYLGTFGVASLSDQELWSLQRSTGAVVTLTWVLKDARVADVVDAQMYGYFDVWNGDWWRVPASAFHHVGLAHLLCNMLANVYQGRWLETRWGSWRYALFIGGASLVSMIPEYLLEQAVHGYSGVLCAIFGALAAQRRWDRWVADRVTPEFVVWALAALVAMIFTTALEILPVANLAHFAGLAYGWGTAELCCSPRRTLRLTRALFVAAHAALVVPYWLVVHPYWLGRYHWYLADSGRAGVTRPADEREASAALQHDPSIAALWRQRAELDLQRSDRLSAWRNLLNGLRYCPSDGKSWSAARRVWRRLVVSDDADAARQIVQDVFGADAGVWLHELRRQAPPPVLIAPDRPAIPTQPLPVEVAERPPEWEPPPDDWHNEPLDAPATPRPFDPARPDSAAEGVLL